jgi:uncharacterized membrane protein YdbT with pleckstrin-like domain
MLKEKILLKVHRSRKPYMIYYVMILALLGYIGYSYYMNNPVSNKFLIISFISILLIIKLTEIHRIRDWWAITEGSFIESKSILNRNIREIDFHTIADISLDQPLFKRIFNYGTVEIRKLIEEKSIVIPNINKPEKFINILRDAIMRDTKNEKRAF